MREGGWEKERERERKSDRERDLPGVIRVIIEFVYSYLRALTAASMDDSTLSKSMMSWSASLSFDTVFFTERLNIL